MVRAVGVAKRLGVRRRVLGHVALRVGVREDVILAAAVDVEGARLREGLDDVVRVGVCEFAHQYVRGEHHLVVVIIRVRVAISVGEVAKFIVVDDVQNLLDLGAAAAARGPDSRTR